MYVHNHELAIRVEHHAMFPSGSGIQTNSDVLHGLDCNLLDVMGCSMMYQIHRPDTDASVHVYTTYVHGHGSM